MELLGIKVDTLTIPNLHRLITEAVQQGERWIIANHNLHSVYLCHREPKMRAFYERATAVHVDGMSLIVLGRLLGLPLSGENRVTYVDWVRPLMQEATRKGWRIFFLGSKPGVAAKAADLLRKELPELHIETHHGYFDVQPGSKENAMVIRLINQYQPHVLMVGMGMPRQEYWILDNLDYLQANVILTAGACMDYIVGVVPTPPRWMGRVGFEWLYRFVNEPRRLWRRYLVEPWFIFGLIIGELLRRVPGLRKT